MRPSHLYERAWGGPRGGGQKLVRLEPAGSISPCPRPPAGSREPRPLIRARQPGTTTHPRWLHLPPEQAFVSGSKLAAGSGALGRGGGATGPRRHCKGRPSLMSCDPHIATEKQRWKGTQETIHRPPTHSVDEQAEAQRGNGTCTRSHSKLETEAGLELQLFWPDSPSYVRPLLCHVP